MKTTKEFDIIKRDNVFVETVQTEVELTSEELLKYCHNLPVRVQQIQGKIAQLTKEIKEKKQEKELAELEVDLEKISTQLAKAKELAEPLLLEGKKQVTTLIKKAKTDKGWKKTLNGDIKAKLRNNIMADICSKDPDWNRGVPWIEEIVKKELS